MQVQLTLKPLSMLIDELAEVKNKIKELKEKEEGLKENILLEMGNASFVESSLYKVEKKPKYTYCWDDSIKTYLRDRNIIQHFVSITDTRIKELLKSHEITQEDKLEIDRTKYIAETKEILYLKAKND